MDLGLDGKVALVTGAGSGIGAVIATALAGEGCVVYFGDVDVEAGCGIRIPGLALLATLPRRVAGVSRRQFSRWAGSGPMAFDGGDAIWKCNIHL